MNKKNNYLCSSKGKDSLFASSKNALGSKPIKHRGRK